ncbi:hypothetical protein [Bacteroides congonensis]
MEKELYKTIEELKETLSDISSARKQVSDTVNAYIKTQEDIQEYINNLDGIECCLDKLVLLLQNNKTVIDQQSSTAVANLQTTCDKVVENTKSELSEASQIFSEKLNSNLRVMSKHVEAFDDAIKKTATLTNNVEKTSNEVVNLVSSVKTLQQELSASQKKQDAILAHINEGVQSLFEDNTKNVVLLQKSIGQVKTIGDNITRKLDNIQQTFETITSKINTTQENIDKEVKNNRYIGIAILVFIIIFALCQYLVG